jgi:N-methylhydantoinase A/oxoprolinase/acetone carboxylase beta subunit
LDKPTDSSDDLVLGIDTGGTYTDGMLMEYHTREVLATHKSITTKRDLSIGIEAVIEGIHIEDPAAVQMVSISTTLATNAIAEKKSKPLALFLVGYDPDLISSFNMQRSFATQHYYYFSGGHDLYGREKQPLDLQAILTKVNEIKDQVDAIAVSSYFSPLNPEHENRAFKAIAGICDLPVVLGHHLSTKLGSVERATTAALNASLLAVLKDFVIAVRRAMQRRSIEAPLMVVRGDGTLMSDEFATQTPVETIHSGPAASAIGGHFLSRLDDALVVDIGGTTTDFALIKNANVTVSEEGATVDGYKTSVKAADLLSIALGGDSRIGLDHNGRMTIGPERVVPLAYLASQYPHVATFLKRLSKRSRSKATPEWFEYWFLLREPGSSHPLKTDREKILIDLISKKPMPLPEILKALNLLNVSQIGAEELLRQEIIGKAGLTPTDLLHAEGRYTSWDRQSAELGLHIFSRYQFKKSDEIRQLVWDRITEVIVHAIVTFLSGKQLNLAAGPENDDMARWFFFNSLYADHDHLETRFRLRQPIIGIGAPAGFFLKDVADKLHTELILPGNYQVANAVGAVAGSVMVEEEILVYPNMSAGLEVLGYYMQSNEGREDFEDVGHALARAKNLSHELALGAALRSGADNPEVVVKVQSDGLDTYRVHAKAMGNPRLGGRQ